MDGSLGIFFYYERELTLEERYNKWFNNNYETGMERFFDPNRLPDFDNPYYEPTPTTKGEWYMATRGSFTSEQAIKGMEIAKMEGLDKKCVPGFTYLFEIIYPENRIVVDYGGDERLVLLSIVNPEGNEIPYEDIEMDGWDIVNRYDGVNDYTELKEMISTDAEGYVIRFKNGMRMKIKGDEYVRLHRILTNFSTTDIWELLKTKGNMDEFLDRVPDEFDKWVRSTIGDLKYAFYQISERAGKLHDGFRYGKYNDVEPEPTKKEFAEFVMKQAEPLRPVMFAMWDGKPYDDIIWKLIKPKWSKPFKKDNDN
jgi:RNA ligase